MDDNRLQARLRYGPHPPRTDATPAPEVIRLGRALYERRAEVIRRSDALDRAAAVQLEPAAQASVARVVEVSFISQLESTTQRDALIRTFVQLGRWLKIETIAEGIEDQAQLTRLQAERCDVGQGFLFARPMEADQCREFVERWAAATPPGTNPASVER